MRSGALTISASTIEDNESLSQAGGGLYAVGVLDATDLEVR